MDTRYSWCPKLLNNHSTIYNIAGCSQLRVVLVEQEVCN